jgi:hypothetical protein
MSEFNNRIAAQRRILIIVNSKPWREELYGLSRGAIERWIHTNLIDPKSTLSVALYESAEKLFFLANKSQEQITDEYLVKVHEIEVLSENLKSLVNNDFVCYQLTK